MESSALAGLSEDERQAFAEATEVVMAYRQIGTDLYSGARTRINDLDSVLTGEKLERERSNVSQGLAQGYSSEPEGAQLVLISAEPVSIDLGTEPPTIVVRACIDATSVTDVAPDGTRVVGARERLDFVVVKTAYLPAPGWAVSETTGSANPEDRAC